MITNDVDEAIVVADRIVALNPGPRASLGPTFTVDLERPRNRTSLNHDTYFQGLRNAVTNYLVAVRQRSRDQEAMQDSHAAVELPDLQPLIPSLPSKAIFR